MNVRPLLKKRETPRLMGATLRKRPCLRVCFGLMGAAMLCVTATAAQQPHETVDPASGNLVGTAGCATCHQEIVKSFANNPHSRPEPIHRWKRRSLRELSWPRQGARGGRRRFPDLRSLTRYRQRRG